MARGKIAEKKQFQRQALDEIGEISGESLAQLRQLRMKIIEHGHQVFVLLRRTIACGFGFEHFEQLNGVARVGLVDLARAGDRAGYVTELHQCLRTQAAEEVEESGFRNFGRVRHARHSARHLFLASGRCSPMGQVLVGASRVLESWKFDSENQSLCQSRKARVRVQGRRGPGRRSGRSPRTTIPRARLRARAGTGLVLRSKTPRRSRGRTRLITAQR